ncbi:MAG: NAD(P)(+) transhydrogenase (Re/Si-specific) subunit beta [Bacteroidota bacterium]
MNLVIFDLLYFVSAVLFIFGMRNLSSPDTAKKGNLLSGVAMALAVIGTLIYPFQGADNGSAYAWIAGGMLIGGGIGWLAAKRIKMTDMPQLVSLFNGLGGACAVVLSLTEGIIYANNGTSTAIGSRFVIYFTLVMGAISFSGSLLAWAKLDGRLKDSTLLLPKHQVFNILLFVVWLVLFVYLGLQPDFSLMWLLVFLGVGLIYGVSFVVPIGGADMPVVIALLNAFTGLTAAAAGLIYNNQVMLLGGILVGSSGTILTVLMCKAMNRSLFNVIIGGFGGGASSSKEQGEQVVKETNFSDLAIQLYYSESVIVVPGYGLAVAQAQKAVKELDDQLAANGVEVKYAIHPVAGRMPGHMNVLLAEADVPYPKLLDLDDANDKLTKCDVVIVVGANDVVNPSALDDPGSPIYGMPILRVWDAKQVIVLKRSMRPGYSGIQNPLFFHEKTKMLFGDAKASMEGLISEVKSL